MTSEDRMSSIIKYGATKFHSNVFTWKIDHDKESTSGIFPFCGYSCRFVYKWTHDSHRGLDDVTVTLHGDQASNEKQISCHCSFRLISVDSNFQIPATEIGELHTTQEKICIDIFQGSVSNHCDHKELIFSWSENGVSDVLSQVMQTEPVHSTNVHEQCTQTEETLISTNTIELERPTNVVKIWTQKEEKQISVMSENHTETEKKRLTNVFEIRTQTEETQFSVMSENHTETEVKRLTNVHERRTQAEEIQISNMNYNQAEAETKRLTCVREGRTQTEETQFLIMSENHTETVLGNKSYEFRVNLSNPISFYEVQTDHDCILKVGGIKFPIHRSVLAAHSTVFAAMFHRDTSESRNGEIDIPDVDADTFADVLHYIYAGKVRGLSPDTAVLMYVVANKFSLIDLRDKCLDFLICNLTVENVCDAAILADTYNEEGLQKAVIQFIKERLQELINSGKWRHFSTTHCILANSLLSSALIESQTDRS